MRTHTSTPHLRNTGLKPALPGGGRYNAKSSSVDISPKQLSDYKTNETSSQVNIDPSISPSYDSLMNVEFHRQIKETNKITLAYDAINKLQILNQFEIIREIGTGTHSKVKLGYDLVLQRPVAVKILNRKERKRIQFKFEKNMKIRKEINILKKCNKHPNIIKLFEVLDDFKSRKIYLILEYCPGGEIRWCAENVHELSAKGPPLISFQRSREMLRDVISGLEYLHLQGIIHRDIKPANLLLSQEGTVKISDFGVSFMNADKANNTKKEDFLALIKTEGTPAFFAPEICLGDEIWDKFHINKSIPGLNANDEYYITEKIDVWALGVTAFCFLFGMLPFSSNFELKLFDKIVNRSLKFPNCAKLSRCPASKLTSPHELESAKNFIELLLTKNPMERPSVSEIKVHQFICWDFNNKVPDDNRTKDTKLQQKLKFLTKQQDQVISLTQDEDNILMNHNIDAFITPKPQRNVSPLGLGNHRSTIPVNDRFSPDAGSPGEIVSVSPKSRNKPRRSKTPLSDNGVQFEGNDNVVDLPINSSFASLDSFYIENFAMTRLNQETQPNQFSTKFKSASTPLVGGNRFNPQSCNNPQKMKKRKEKRKHSKNSSYSAVAPNPGPSTILKVQNVPSYPSARLLSNGPNINRGLSPHHNQSGASLSSDRTMSSVGSRSRLHATSPNSSSIPKLTALNTHSDSPPTAFDVNSTIRAKSPGMTHRQGSNFKEASATSSSSSSCVSQFTTSPVQPSYHITSEDASVVSFRNLPGFSALLPQQPMEQLSLSFSSGSSSCGGTGSSDSDSESDGELVLNLGKASHMRRQQSQHTQNSSSAVNSPLTSTATKRGSLSHSLGNKSATSSYTNLRMNTVNENNVVMSEFIGSDLDSRALLKGFLEKKLDNPEARVGEVDYCTSNNLEENHS